MKYLKLYEDKVNNQFGKELVKMKSLPYNEFMPKLIQTMNDPNFKTKLQSTIKSTDKIEDYGISKEKTLTAKSLIPTQVNIGLKESLSWMSEKGSINQIIVEGVASVFSKNRILTLNNKWIIEGHQKWA